MYKYDELSKKLHEELDVMLAKMKQDEPKDGIVDIKLINTATDENFHTTVNTYLTEIVECIDGTWVLEERREEYNEYEG